MAYPGRFGQKERLLHKELSRNWRQRKCRIILGDKMSTEQSQYDKMMNTPIPKLIAGLAVPTILTMMVTNVYNVVDTAFVGQLGTSASGAIGVVFGFMSILQAIGFTFGQGSGSIISRLLGTKDIERAGKVASTAFFMAFFMAVLAGILCFICLDDLVYALGSTSTIAPYAKTYIIFILATSPFMVTSFTLNNILRYEGRANLGMIGMMSGALLNIAGDAIFMFGMHMGIAGAGLSTAISQVVGFCILIGAFLSGRTQCKLRISLVMWNIGEIWEIIATGMPSLLRQGLNSITTIMLNTQAAVYGDAAVAGMSIVSRLFFFVFSVAIGVGQSFQPVSGFSYGAKQYDRLKSAYKVTWLMAQGLMLVLGTLMYIFAPTFVGWLRDDPEVIVVGTRALRLQCVALLFLPLCMVTEMLMQSTGQKLVASILSSLRNGILFIPCLYILAYVRGLAGIEEAQPLAYVLAFGPSVYFAKRFFSRLGGTADKTSG